MQLIQILNCVTNNPKRGITDRIFITKFVLEKYLHVNKLRENLEIFLRNVEQANAF